MHAAARAVALAAVLSTTGCATLTKGTVQSVTVATDPSGAICTLTRAGKPLAIVNPTPGSITVDRSVTAVTIECKRKDYLDAVGTMSSEFQAMTFGNILFGGLIGVAIDAASGAMHEYPATVTITLIPEQFDSIAARDEFFARMKATLMREAEEVKKLIETRCRDQCTYELANADKATQEKLAEIEAKRMAARVRAAT